MSDQEQQPQEETQFFSQATYAHPTTPVSTKKKFFSFSIKSIGETLLHSIAQTLQNFFYQTTLIEKIVILASIASILLCFTKWGSLGKEIITGMNHATFLIGWFIVISASICLLGILWALSGRSFPKFFPSLSLVQIIVGLEIVQLSILAYTIIKSYSTTISFEVEEPTYSLILLVLCGTLIFTAGLFEEHNQHKRSLSSTKLPQDMYKKSDEDTNDLQRILKSE